MSDFEIFDRRFKGYVLFNADSLAKIGGLVWLVLGGLVFALNVIRGRGVPELAEEAHSEA